MKGRMFVVRGSDWREENPYWIPTGRASPRDPSNPALHLSLRLRAAGSAGGSAGSEGAALGGIASRGVDLLSVEPGAGSGPGSVSARVVDCLGDQPPEGPKYGRFPNFPKDLRTMKKAEFRLVQIRGGCWINRPSFWRGTSNRTEFAPTSRDNGVGLRGARRTYVR